MKRLILSLLAVVCASCVREGAANTEMANWTRRAQNVTITRDDWGIAHVYGKTDADAVFGMIYAQAEDDFNRVETNFINSMGRLAEAEGEAEIYRDLRMKIFIDPDSIKAQYASSPGWLKTLMGAWADGLNFYLAKHPEVKPRVITRFEPWMALTFSEGSIGGDIEGVNLRGIEEFYGKKVLSPTPTDDETAPIEPGGSNGAAIAPSNTTNHRSLLLINPHTSFFFRSELQMVSDEGLNVYGAATWGQLFIYQGFNDRAGWMHTTSAGDDVDDYAETVTKKGDGYTYKYGNEERPVMATRITVPYKTASGMAKREFTVYRTHHGPIIREADGKWVAVRMMHDPVKALTQSYSRTKAKNYKAFKQTMELHTNSSNNTIFADADGNIAYFHANFIPRRDARFNWRQPVDGSDPATEWNGLLSVDESPNLLNPASGWLYNSNNWPWSAAGPSSLKKADYPAYVDNGSESARGLHAVRVFKDKKDFTIATLRDAAYDSYLTAFEPLIPALVKAYDQTPASDPVKVKVAEQVKMLRDWDLRWGVNSIPTSLAIAWAEEAGRRAGPGGRGGGDNAIANAPASALLEALVAASDKLTADFGTWKTPWGNINRFQRTTGDIVQPFDDSKPSIPVGFTVARWGSLASFAARTYKGSKKIYGASGNSFVAVVEFGSDSVRAIAVTAGGESGHVGNAHFNDQAQRYATGDLRPVYFYKSQLKGHTQKEYKPGE